MNNPITLRDFLLFIGLGGGIGTMGFGVLSWFGNMMADAQGDSGKQGCIISLVGLVLFGACLIGLMA